MKIKTCDYCGKPFYVSKRHLKYCSLHCYTLARKEYKRRHYQRNKTRYNSKKCKKSKLETKKRQTERELSQLLRQKKIYDLGLTKEQLKRRENRMNNDLIPADIDDFDTNLEEILINNNEMINTLEEKLLKDMGKVK